ncbi:hypothetical protein ElyMa_001502700 [Elysia marginata]|uniref:Uncharacterized protein n=1 Tax=Elysia marginata TaxID=1093978 RepID=A0AAV4J6T3_9GAST|nr:hypothetical protein ElyMa_001502700 [Elysia marginata]
MGSNSYRGRKTKRISSKAIEKTLDLKSRPKSQISHSTKNVKKNHYHCKYLNLAENFLDISYGDTEAFPLTKQLVHISFNVAKTTGEDQEQHFQQPSTETSH